MAIAILVLAVLAGGCASPSVEPGASLDDFTTYLDATIALRVLVGLVLLVSLWGAYRLVRGFRRGRRRWAPLSGTSWGLRLLQGALGLGGISGLAWSAAQPYLMVASIFPGLVNWAGSALLILSVLLVMLASFPYVDERAATDV